MRLLPYDALVLAGGSASRLGGVDKPAQRVGTGTLLERVLAAVGDADRRIVVGPRRRVSGVDVWTQEQPPGGGPVAAIAAGLPHVTAPVVALLAADLPFLTAATMTVLRESLDRDGVVVVDDGGRRQLLVGMWLTAALRRLQLTPGASLHGTVGRLAVRPLRVAGTPPPWFDCDTDPDLQRARELA